MKSKQERNWKEIYEVKKKKKNAEYIRNKENKRILSKSIKVKTDKNNINIKNMKSTQTKLKKHRFQKYK